MGISVLGSNKYRFTDRQLSKLRGRAARNGYAINKSDIQTTEDAMDTAIKAAPDRLVADLLAFIEKRIVEK